MTSEEARNYFVQKGLSYEDITEVYIVRDLKQSELS